MRIDRFLAPALLAWAALPFPALAASRGYMDYSGKVVVAPRFSSAGAFSEGRAVVWADGKCSMIGLDGKVIKGGYADAGTFTGGRLAVQFKRDAKWAYMDRDGKWITKAEYLAARDFSEGLAAVKTDSGFGYIDTSGKWVIPPQYKDAGRFSEGLAHVVGEKPPAFFINREGKTVIPKAGSAVTRYPFKDGFACLENTFHDTWFFIDTSGAKLPHPTLTSCWPFDRGYAAVAFKDTVAAGGRTGLIDRTGKVALAGGYRNFGRFSHGLSPVVISTDECQYLDATGKARFTGPDSMPFVNCGSFESGLAIAQPYRKGYGLIDTLGKFVLAPIYRHIDRGESLLVFIPGDGDFVLNSEKTGKISSLISSSSPSSSISGAAPRRHVIWWLVRPGTRSADATRYLEYAEVSLSSDLSPSAIASRVGWRIRMAWILEQSGMEPLQKGENPGLKARHAAFGPMHNAVKNVQERSLGSFEM